MTATPTQLNRRGGSRSLIERLAIAANVRLAHRKKIKLRRRELTYLLRNLAALLDNGLPLAKALAVLAKERSLRRRGEMLETVRRKIETGGTLSGALADFPETFDSVLTCQIQSGERAGTLAQTLQLIARQLDESDQVRSQVIRKLAYPTILLVAGTAAVTFMLLFVIPVFEKTYSEAGVPLPWITRALIAFAKGVMDYGWIVPATAVSAGLLIRTARRSPASAYLIDLWLLRLPGLGDWWRNIVVLRFMEVLGNLLESGFKVVEALEVARGVVTNAAIAQSVARLESAVLRGERFSREVDNLGDLFPPVVGQLVVVGEKTGTLAKASGAIRQHLRREIEHQTRVLVGIIEPTLTIGLAVMIGIILLAIYLPMFDMIGAMNAQAG
jgi:type IV pilus assembly protein PilC